MTYIDISETYINHHTLGIQHQEVWNETKDRAETPTSFSALCSYPCNSTSRPLQTNSTVQNVRPDVLMIQSKNENDPTVQSPWIGGFLGCCN